MYNQADCLAPTANYWALIRDGLRAAGLAAPDHLSWDMPDFLAHWQRDDLVLSQTCGFPFRAVLHGHVTLIGTPDFGVEGCAPGYYRSVFIARQGDPRCELTAFRDARFAYNDAMSQSGWAAAQNHAKGLGFQFENALQSGGHALSAQAVLTGQADIAAIDAVSWRHLLRNDPALAELQVVGYTNPTPGLPYIAALGADHGILFGCIAAAISALTSSDRATLGLKGIVKIPAAAYLAVPTPAPSAHNVH